MLIFISRVAHTQPVSDRVFAQAKHNNNNHSDFESEAALAKQKCVAPAELNVYTHEKGHAMKFIA